MMRSKKIQLTLYSLANVAASFPIFVVGGSFIFTGNRWAYFGLASMIYAALSCILLFFTLINPTRGVLVVDRVSILVMLSLSLWDFAIQRMFEYGLIFACGATVLFVIKWLSHTYAFQHQTLTRAS